MLGAYAEADDAPVGVVFAALLVVGALGLRHRQRQQVPFPALVAPCRRRPRVAFSGGRHGSRSTGLTPVPVP